ncbi:hypothetical protein SAMN05216251_10285 [Actinacidiphila alni]|uniref:Uncharacterized protein n=2 Tax=Actinacidiphila alni TaxID=380248 RepID=A0A1I1YR94_9ACTN|nr:hypothetical protein SAMN05216251_10285 [Actinacidiphila alni]
MTAVGAVDGVERGVGMDEQVARQAEAEVRRARFGVLPGRVRAEDMVQEVPASAPDPAKDTYNEDEWLVRNVL